MATQQQLAAALKAADAAGNVEDARRLAKAYAAGRAQEAAAKPSLAPVAEEAPDPTGSFGENLAAGFGQSFVSTGRGLKQAGTDAARYFVEEGLGMEAPGLRKSLTEQQTTIDEARRLDAPLLDTGGGLTGSVLGYGAQLLGPAALARGTVAAKALLPTTVAGNATQGAVIAGAQPVATGETRIGNAGVGAAFGAGGSTLAKGVGAAAGKAKSAVTEQARAVFLAAKERGITLSPSQISDSRFLKWTQSMLRSVPFTGAQKRFDRQVGDFNRQLAGTIGEDADQITTQVYANAKNRQSQQFTDLTTRNALKVDDRLVRSLTNIAESSRMGGEQINNQVEAAIDALYAQATTGKGGVVIPGEAYQAFDAQMNNIIKSGGPPAHFLGNVQSAVRRAMDDSISPEDSAAWKALRREYGNRKTLTRLVANANDGPISPAQVQGAVTANRSGKEAMASGSRGELGELARIGQRMKEPPSSGTAERLSVSAMLGGGAVLDPVTGGLSALGLNLLSRGMDSAMLTKFIMRENPGMTRAAAAKLINAAAKPAGQNYLNQRPLEIDVVGGTPISSAEAQRLYGR